MVAPKSTIIEDVTSQVDGVAVTFTLSKGPFVAGTLNVEHNGVRLLSGASNDFTEAITFDGFTMLCTVPLVGDTLQVQFEIEDLGAGFPLVVASGVEC